MTGSDFPFFKPSTSSFECDFVRVLRSSNRQRRVTSKRDVKCLYIDAHLDWIMDAIDDLIYSERGKL